jgi:hypothetical protein
MTPNPTTTSAAGTTASAPAGGAPSQADLELLRVQFLTCGAVTQAVDIAAGWFSKTLTTAPSKAGSRTVACLRLARPSGVLRSVRILVDGAAKDQKLNVPRAALAGFGVKSADVAVRNRADDPLVVAFRAMDPTIVHVLTAPVFGVQGLWGLLCVGHGNGEEHAAFVLQCARAASRRLSEYLESQQNVLKCTILDANPRAPLDLNAFLTRVGLGAASEPVETGERQAKESLAILVYSCGALTPDANARRRWIQTVARAAISATRSGDFASVLGDEAIAFALTGADPGACGAVAQRVRASLARQLPEASLGGFAYQCFAAGSKVKAADLARIAETARSKRVMKTP